MPVFLNECLLLHQTAAISYAPSIVLHTFDVVFVLREKRRKAKREEGKEDKKAFFLVWLTNEEGRKGKRNCCSHIKNVFYQN